LSGSRIKSSREIAAVVHDVRQMLAVITGRAGLLRHGISDPNIEENLFSIEQAAIQANTILARLAQSSVQDYSSGCDISRTLELTATLIRPRPDLTWRRGILPEEISEPLWYLNAPLPGECFTTLAQPVLLEVCSNILLNALAVMPDGGQISASLKRVGDFWKLRIQDSGPGVPAELRNRIFETGFSTSRDEERGIGLSSSRDLMTSNGGNLELLETQTSGACFQLTMPWSSACVAVETAPSGIQDFRHTVLVVDDDRAVREMLHDVLRELGCRVEVARDAPSAAGFFPTTRFDLVIIDQNLPGKSGLEFAKDLRKLDSDLVLVLISGWGQEEILDKAPDAVIDLVGEKPVTVDGLIDILNRAAAIRTRRQKESP